jgi:hypothetical protein
MRPPLPFYRCDEPKREGWRYASRIDEELLRVGRLPFLVLIYCFGGGEGFSEFDTFDEAQQATDAFNYTEDFVAILYDADGRRTYDCGGVTK